MKKFLKPDKRKILLFIILFLLLPFPMALHATPGGLQWLISPFTIPLAFIISVLKIIFLELDFYGLDEYVFFFVALFSPVIVYLLSCLSIFAWNKSKNWRRVLFALIFILIILVVMVNVLQWRNREKEGTKWADSRIKVYMAEFRAGAELYHDDNGSYTGLSCDTNKDVQRICESVKEQSGIQPIIYTSSDKYCGHAKLPSKDDAYWCVDYAGGRGYGQCDRETFKCLSE